MDHIVYLDSKATEFEKLKAETKSCIIRGAAGRKMPYGKVNKDNILYFINNNGKCFMKRESRYNYPLLI